MSKSKPSKSTSPPSPGAALARRWALPAVAGVMALAAVVSYAQYEEREAAPGSPYYDKAVREAVNGLANPGAGRAAAVPANRPPLAAGLNPAEYYWCDNCQTYHKREGGAPAAGHAPPEAAVPGVPEVVPPGGRDAAASRPPLAEGLNPDEHYWCENCQTYHKRGGIGN